MKLSSTSLVLISLCVGLVAAILVFHFLTKERVRTVQSTQRILVVVTTHPIAARTVIDPAAVKISLRQASAVPAGCATSVDEVIGQVTVTPIGQGELILREAVVPRTASLGLAFAVPPGMRAVAVSLDPIIGVAGFLKPSDRVDVVATFTMDELKATKTVLQDVALLAIGSDIRPNESSHAIGDKDSSPKDQPNAILAVTPAQAEKLILAEVSGRLRLTLRSVGDQSNVALAGVRSDTLFGIMPTHPTSAGITPVPKQSVPAPITLAAAPSRPTTTKTTPVALAAAVSSAAGQENTKPAHARDTQSIETIRGTQKSIVEVPIELITTEKSTTAP
ncbi:MAG TPA: Flp pilus assembly protein CpaB [Anaerolineae bacterium]|jgi:pilus assembly protein CpaB